MAISLSLVAVVESGATPHCPCRDHPERSRSGGLVVDTVIALRPDSVPVCGQSTALSPAGSALKRGPVAALALLLRI